MKTSKRAGTFVRDRRTFIAVAGGATASVVLLGVRRPGRAEVTSATVHAHTETAHTETAHRETAPAPRVIPSHPLPVADDGVCALFGGLRAGTRLGPYVVEAVHGLLLGAIPVVLRGADQECFQLDVLRRGATSGVGNSEGLSVFLVNKGNGSQRSVNDHGLAAVALAALLGRREAAGATPPAALLTLEQRAAQHPRGIFAAIT